MAFKFPNMIPASVGTPLGDVIAKLIHPEKLPKSDIMVPPHEAPPRFDPTTANDTMRQDPQVNEHLPVYGLSAAMARIRNEGVAKTNQFMVLLHDIPASIINSIGDWLADDYINPFADSSFFSTSVESVSFPGASHLTSEYRKYGMVIKVPYLRDYQEVTIVFRCNAEMWEREFFDSWQNVISNTSTLDFKFKDTYVTGITIAQLDNTFEIMYAQTIRNAYPTAVSSLESSHGDQNNYHRVAVTFTYDFVQQRQDIIKLKSPQVSVLDTSIATATPNYPNTKSTPLNKAKLSPIDRIMGELMKSGKGLVNNQIIKHIPIGNIPGVPPLSL
jgi:hypothetical protein